MFGCKVRIFDFAQHSDPFTEDCKDEITKDDETDVTCGCIFHVMFCRGIKGVILTLY